MPTIESQRPRRSGSKARRAPAPAPTNGAAKKMAAEHREKLQVKAQAIVDRDGLMKTAASIPMTYATLRRFLCGAPMHEGTLSQIKQWLDR